MKSVIFVLTYFMGGGIEKVFIQIAKALTKENYNVYLFVINGMGKNVDNIPNKVHVIRSKSELLQYRRKIKNGNWIVVNFSSDWKSSSTCRYLSGNDYISWIHTDPMSMWKARTRVINFFLLKRSKLLVTVCEEQRTLLKERYGFKNPITTIYNAVDIENARRSAKEEMPFKKKYILMVSRIDYDTKDFTTVLKAYGNLPNEIKDGYTLVFLGDGKDKRILIDEINELKLNNHVFLAGYDHNPYKWYKNAEVGILSSRSEGINLSVIEALTCGCKMVITKYHTGSYEVSGNGRFCKLVDVGNSDQMRDAIMQVLDGRYKLHEKELNDHCMKFDIKRFNKSIILLFEKL